MRAVENDEEFHVAQKMVLFSGSSLRVLYGSASYLSLRLAAYFIFIDHVNKARLSISKLAGLEVKMSNLCSEITLPTGIDHHDEERTAVVWLRNLETWDEWNDNPKIIEDIMSSR